MWVLNKFTPTHIGCPGCVVILLHCTLPLLVQLQQKNTAVLCNCPSPFLVFCHKGAQCVTRFIHSDAISETAVCIHRRMSEIFTEMLFLWLLKASFSYFFKITCVFFLINLYHSSDINNLSVMALGFCGCGKVILLCKHLLKQNVHVINCIMWVL